MKPKVIITRTQPGADALASHLQGLGYDAIAMPLLAVEATGAVCPIPPATVRGIIITSAQALRFFDVGGFADTPMYAVGDATAKAARDAGLKNVTNGGGDVATLAACVRAVNPQGQWLHIGADEVAAGTDDALAGIGAPVARWAVYRTVPAPLDTDRLQAYLQGDAPFIATVHSPKGGAVLAEAVRVYGSHKTLHQMFLLCLSQAVLKSVTSVACGNMYVARTPDENALVDALRNAWPPTLA